MQLILLQRVTGIFGSKIIISSVLFTQKATLRNQRIMSFYAVRKGRTPGVYSTWNECLEHVNKFPKAEYKKFKSEKEAWDFVKAGASRGKNPTETTHGINDHKFPDQIFKPLGQVPDSRFPRSFLSTVRLNQKLPIPIDVIELDDDMDSKNENSKGASAILIEDKGRCAAQGPIVRARLPKVMRMDTTLTNDEDVIVIDVSDDEDEELNAQPNIDREADTLNRKVIRTHLNNDVASRRHSRTKITTSINSNNGVNSLNEVSSTSHVPSSISSHGSSVDLVCPTCNRPGYIPLNQMPVNQVPVKQGRKRKRDISSKRSLHNRQPNNSSKRNGDHLRISRLEGELSRLLDQMDNADAVQVYTDGACTNNGKKGAKAGIGVWWGDNNPLNVSLRIPGKQTNNRAEIQAAVKALEIAKSMGEKKVILYTDSQFVIDGITKWIHGWKARGWKLASGGPVKNEEDFKALDRARTGLQVKWVHVKGHCGIRGNEMADFLATQAIKIH